MYICIYVYMGYLCTQNLWFISVLRVGASMEAAEEFWFFHGTSHAAAEGITSDDFDLTRANPSGTEGFIWELTGVSTRMSDPCVLCGLWHP